MNRIKIYALIALAAVLLLLLCLGGQLLLQKFREMDRSANLERLKEIGVYTTVMGGSAENLEILLQSGASPDEKGPDGNTGLAALIGYAQEPDDEAFKKAELLLQYGANPNQTGIFSETVVDLARGKNMHRFVDLLTRYQAQ